MELQKVGLVLTYFCLIFIFGGLSGFPRTPTRELTSPNVTSFRLQKLHQTAPWCGGKWHKRVKWKHRFWDQGTPHLPIEVFCIGPIDSTWNPYEVTGVHLLPHIIWQMRKNLQIWDMNLCIMYVYVQIRHIMYMNMYTWLNKNIYKYICHAPMPYIRMSSVFLDCVKWLQCQTIRTEG